MFSKEEKQKIADAVEKVLLDINHPEMPDEKPMFKNSYQWQGIVELGRYRT